jgi:hypothetical protein
MLFQALLSSRAAVEMDAMPNATTKFIAASKIYARLTAAALSERMPEIFLRQFSAFSISIIPKSSAPARLSVWCGTQAQF